jgi:hypothetical protein
MRCDALLHCTARRRYHDDDDNNNNTAINLSAPDAR